MLSSLTYALQSLHADDGDQMLDAQMRCVALKGSCGEEVDMMSPIPVMHRNPKDHQHPPLVPYE
jgi:hypothetical protein